jgi:hypothetical protein
VAVARALRRAVCEEGFTCVGGAQVTEMLRSLPRSVLAVTVIALLLPLSACAGWSASENDAVREAVVGYELGEPGVVVDDLVVRLSPREFRSDLGHSSRMVWLVSNSFDRAYREGEYFRLRDPERSYLFIQDVRYDSSRNAATVRVVLYLVGDQPQTEDITLRRKALDWQVVPEATAQ